MAFWKSRYWKDIKFNRYLWERTYKGYADLLREQEYITSRISGSVKDPMTQEKTRRALSRANQAWINVNVSGYSLQNIEFKSLELTPQEAVLYMAYREAAFSVFYRCCAMVYDFQLTSGRITRERWEECMKGAKAQELLP